MSKFVSCSLSVIFASMLAAQATADGTPVFHLDFSRFDDVSGNGLAIEAGDAVSLVPGGGPMLDGGKVLDSGRWAGEEDETNQIIIFDHEILDAVTVGAGSIVSWIKPDDGDEWNNIAKTPCEDNIEPCDAFGQFAGIEFQSSGPHAGVFGAVQGWDTNVFGPDTPLGEGGETDTPSGEWTHAALTWNADGDHTIYVNGRPGDVVEGVGDFDFGENLTDDWTIGGDGLGTHPETADASRYLRGELADFAIFDGELTAAEIADIIQSGVQSGPGLLGDFDRSGALDLPDVNMLAAAIAGQSGDVSFDLNEDNTVSTADLNVWVKDLKGTWIGDSDLDGEFGSSDFVKIFASAKYEREEDATWGEGDWTGDLRFSSSDLVAAFSDGGFEKGPRVGVVTVPEPSGLASLLLGIAFAIVSRRVRSQRTIRTGTQR